MADYDFDETNPEDTALISAYPANERAQRLEVKSWADREHSLAGRHTIPNGSGTGSRPATDLVAGNWYLDLTAFMLDYYTGSAWTEYGLIGPGDMMLTGYATPRRGWLLCNGDAVSRTTYARLFGVIDTKYGAGNGSTTFNVPDFRSRVPIVYHSGGDSDGHHGTLGVAVGSKTITIGQTNLPDYDLTVTDPGHEHTLGATTTGVTAGGSAINPVVGTGGPVAVTGITVNSAGDGTPLDARPLALVVAVHIKT